MNLSLYRLTSNSKNTLSFMLMDSDFFGFVPEDAWHEEKIKGETRIPEGIYDVKWTESPRFGHTFEIMNVPGYTGVRFHVLNDFRETEGCVGAAWAVAKVKEKGIDIWRTSQSGLAMEEFNKRLHLAENAGETIRIRITDELLHLPELW